MHGVHSFMCQIKACYSPPPGRTGIFFLGRIPILVGDLGRTDIGAAFGGETRKPWMIWSTSRQALKEHSQIHLLVVLPW